MSNSLRDLFVSIAFKDNASKAVQNVNKSMDNAKRLMTGATGAATDVGNAVKNAAGSMQKTSSATSQMGKTVSAVSKTMSGLKDEFSSANYDINDFGKSVKKAGTTTSSASKLIGSSGKTFARTSRAVQDARKSYLTAEKTIQSTGRTVDGTSKKVGLMGRAFDSVKRTVSSTGSAFGRFTKNAASGVSSAVGNISRSVNNAKSSLSGLGRSASIGFGSVVSGAASMAGAIGIVQAFNSAINMVKSSMNSAFGRIDTMEQFGRVMTTMLGTSEAANDALATTNEIVKGTAYGLDTAAGSVQRFTTSGTDIQKTTGYVAAFGDAVAFYGDGSDETFARVNSAMAEMATSGKASLGQVRALTEANIPVFQIYAEATGKSTESVMKSLETGKISADTFLDTITSAMMDGTKSFKSIKGAAKEAGASWGGSFANMRAAVARGTQSIIESIDKLLTDNGLPDMRGLIANFGSAFEDALKNVASAIPAIVNVIKPLFKTISPLFKQFSSSFSEVATPLKAVFSTVGEAVTSLVDNVIIPKLPLIKESFQTYMESVQPIAETVWSVLQDLGSVVMDLVENIILPLIPVAQNIMTASFTAIQPVLNIVKTVFSTISSVVMFLVENVIVPLIPVAQSIITTAFDLINPIIRIASSLFEQAWIVIQFLVENIVLPLVPLISTTISGMWDIVKPILDGIITVFEGIADAIEWAVGKFKSFADAASSFKMPKIGMPKWMGGNGVIQMGSHAKGLGRVPYDEYPMFAHKDEAVLTAEQSNALRTAGMLKGDGTGPTLDLSGLNNSMPVAEGETINNSPVTQTTERMETSNVFNFNISGDNAKDIALEVRKEVEKIFTRLNAGLA